MNSWAKLAAERRRATAEVSRSPTPPLEKADKLQPDPGSGGARATPGATRQMSNIPNVPNTFSFQGSHQGDAGEVGPFGTVGAVGSWHVSQSAAHPDEEEPSLNTVPASSGPLPDPLDLAERAAILEADGVHREAAETQALKEVGLSSWETYAATLGVRLRSQVETVAGFPPANRLQRYWQVLGRQTLSFLDSGWWPLTCRYGWALTEVFGVDRAAPLVRIDAWRLADAPALSSLPHTRLVELTCEGAAFATLSGGRLSWPRFSGQQPEQVISWWELVNN